MYLHLPYKSTIHIRQIYHRPMDPSWVRENQRFELTFHDSRFVSRFGSSFQKGFGRVQDRFRLFDVQVLFDQKKHPTSPTKMCGYVPPPQFKKSHVPPKKRGPF